MLRKVKLLLGTVFCLLAALNITNAQTVTGSLVGHIDDTTGAVLAGARVVVTEVNRGTKRELVTNEEGNYSINSLEPGIYRVEIEQANFKKYIRENVEVTINSTVRVDAQLEAGGVSEVVQVVSDPVQLKTDRADVSAQITREQVEELPLSADRNYQSILDTTPGVTEAATVGSSFGNPNGSLVSRVNGQNERYNNFQLDGTINNQTNVISQTAIVPPPEAIEVVDVSTNSYDAEQGRAAGGVVNVGVKSGTNRFRGTVFAYNTNSAFKASNTLTRIEPPQTNLNQFGGVFGGPIIKDKTFFFVYYQGGRDRRGQNVLLTVPIAAYRNGDFSSILPAAGCGAAGNVANCIYDPGLTGQTTAASRAVFAGNRIPVERISAAAKAILDRMPLPNLPGTVNNYAATGTFRQNRDDFGIKINHNFSDKTNAFVRYSFFRAQTSDLPAFGDIGGPSSSGGATASEGPGRNHSISANIIHVFSPSLITEFRFGYVQVHITGGVPSEEGLGNTVGIPRTNQDDFFTATGLPQITITGYETLGAATTLPFDITEKSFNIVNNWTKIIGNHTIRFGADIRRLKLDKFQVNTGNARGVYAFTGGLTTRSGAGNSNNAIASFLLGLPQNVSKTTVAQLGGYKTPQYFFYAQDRWQVNPKLTVNYGLRWEIYPYPTGTAPGDQSYYDPTTNTALISGYGSVNDRLNVNTEYTNFAPRLGVAYRLNDKTVIRTGYGISYVPITLNTLANQNYGSQINVQFTGANVNVTPRDANGNAITFSTGIPGAQIIDLTSGVVVPPTNVVLGVVNPNAKRGYIQSYNFTAERQFWGFVGSAGYVGSRGTRLPGTVNLNAVGPGGVAADRPFNKLYGRTTDILLSDFMLSNAYHSLQVRLDRRFKKVGGRLTVAYTLSRSQDYTSAFSIDNDIIYDANKGPSDFDRRHNLVISHVIGLPFGRNRLFLKDGIGSKILGGFSLSGVFTARSGTPVDITGSNAAGTVTVGSANRPDQIGEVTYLGGLGPGEKFFDTTVFVNPASGQFGNSTRNSVRGPSYYNYNATLSRTFSFTERFKLQFLATAFNVFNTPHFSNPSGTFTSSNFGVSTTTFGERSMRFGLRFSF